MHLPSPRLLRRLAGAAACSGTSGVTVVVDTGSSTSIRCASGDPGSALKALVSAGFSVTYPQQYPGSVVCRINGYPESDPCVRMPPADAYWAFFHAKRGGSWTYSSNGVASYNPAPGTVVGFRFGSGQQPRVAPPEPTATSKPAPTTAKPPATSTPKKTTAAPKPSTAAPATRSTSATTNTGSTPGTGGPASTRASASTSPSGSPSPSATASGSASVTPSATDDATTVAAAPTSEPGDGSGAGTLLLGGALVALVAAAAGYVAWTRRG